MISTPSPEAPRSAQQMVDQNVEAILALQSSDEQAMTRHQRAVERMVLILTFPAFLYGLVIFIALWIGVNIGIRMSGGGGWDKPPFAGLQTVVSVIALLMTSVIVITQSRQGKVAERHAHLDLQVNLLVDQKAAKIIQLLEEMRVDSPTLRNRKDELAEELQVAVDAVHVASVIAEKMVAHASDVSENSETSEGELSTTDQATS